MVRRLLIRLLLLTYPRRFRREHRAELAATLQQCLDAERSRHRVGGTWISAVKAVRDAVSRGELVAEATATSSRDRPPRPPRWHRDVIPDVRYALRAGRRSPLFFGGLVLILALGVGANSAVFSLVRAVLLDPLPFRDPDGVVMIWRSRAVPDEFWRSVNTTKFLLGWREHGGDVLDVAGAKLWLGNLEAQVDLVRAEGAERLRGAFVSPNFFEILGAHADTGRLFTAADESPASVPVAVVSHAFFQTALGGRASAIGERVTLVTGRASRTARDFTIVGVLAREFQFTYPRDTDVWVLHPWSEISREPGLAIAYHVVGRLRPGVTMAEAGPRLAALHDQIDPAGALRPITQRTTTRLEPIRAWLVGDAARLLALLSAVAGLLLLLTSATVASALFVRVTERGRELGMRRGLGATAGRLLRQLLTEGFVLAACGSAAGLLLASATLPVLRALVPSAIARGDHVRIDPWVLLFGAVAAGVITVLATLAPAWRGSTLDVGTSLKRSATATTSDRVSSRWRKVLVAGQSAIAASLIVTTALLLMSFWRLARVPLGFEADDVVTMEMRLMSARYREPAAIREFQTALMTQVRAIPGVVEAGLTSAVPFRGVDWTVQVVISDAVPDAHLAANVREVDPAYFSIMRISSTRGRLFTEHDRAASEHVAVVSESFARRAFGNSNPIGRRIQAYSQTDVVVGVVPDLRYVGLDREPRPAVFVPRSQHPTELICVVLRTTFGGPGLADSLRAAVRRVDPAVPAMEITTIGRIIDGTVAPRRFYTVVTSTFALLAFVLTMVGLAVMVSRAVVERRKELAIRTALGASRTHLVGLVLRQGALPVIVGSAVGLTASAISAPVLNQFLFQTSARNLTAYVAVAVWIVLTGLTASVLPARRAVAATILANLRSD